MKNRNEKNTALSFFDKISRYRTTILSILGIIIIASVFYPMVFQNLQPGGTDIIAGRGKMNQVSDWSEKTGETAYWNPVLFSGMPVYWKTDTVKSIDSFFYFIGRIFGGRGGQCFVFYLLGFAGMMFLGRHLKFPPFASFTVALGFVLIPHWASLIQIGHFMKFRPIMLFPLLTVTALRILKKPGILNLALFSLSFAFLIRMKHYQITFYALLILLFIGIRYFAGALKNKKPVGKSLIFLLFSAVLVFALVLQPFLLAKEFTPFSIRGGTGEENSKGLDINYATGWSFHPMESFNFLIPRFFGGTSGETYNINNPQFPHLAGKKMPGYWGHMPFTETTEYTGIIIIFFALIGLIANRKNSFVQAMFALGCLTYVLSFGRHFLPLYNVFFSAVPFFNKFRVPAMALVVNYFIATVFAGYGIQAFFASETDEEKKNLSKYILIAGGFLIAVSLLAFALSSGLDYSRGRDLAQYKGNVLEMIKAVRREFLVHDAQRLLMFSLLVSVLAFLFAKKIFFKHPFSIALVLCVLMFIDFYQIQGRYLIEKVNGKYTNLSYQGNMVKNYFKKKKYDEFLDSRKEKNLEFESFRIYPLMPNIWNSNDYSYFHQSIGGYSPAKLRIVQDLMDFGRMEKTGIFARNILDMLNAEYYLADRPLPGSYPFDNLEEVFRGNDKIVYQNKKACGRAWFVGDYEIKKTRKERFDLLKSDKFDVHKKAILETELPQEIKSPQNAKVILTKLNPNEVEFKTENENQSLLVVSEIYYPKGWKAFTDGKETPFYKTDHVLRSVIVPAGEHTVKFKMVPKTLISTHLIGESATVTAVALLLIGIFFELKKKKNGKDILSA
ncbi:MAG: hypothetical protein CSB55_00335 [Candidatus Cloacimonadota bacterium]|nr:MAG: hypothetical protein CSB55_00335 [Candidatus Cloacimonadota bacterium]